MKEILTIEDKKSEKFLRTKTVPFDFAKHSKREIRDLVKSMRETMKKAQGVGLSANQIGLPFRMFVAQVPDQNGRPKFYALFNPEIAKVSKETEALEEGCLSVPGIYGTIDRHARVALSAQDANGKKVKINAWGLLAQVFQHETGHLDGGLFIDKARETHAAPTSERLAEREEKMRK